MSSTGQAAAEARRRANSALGYYNLKIGPVGWRFQAGLGLDFSDNVRYRSENREADFILRPQLTTRMLWPLTERNSLNLAVGVGYSKYVNHPELDRFFLRPGSELAFDVYVGDFLINIHDRFSIPMNVYEVPTAGGRGDYQRLENVAGVSADWDLNRVVVSFGYDHADYVSLNDAYAFADGSSELFFVRAGTHLSSTTRGGVELGAALVDYRDPIQHDGMQYSAGLFYGGQISRYLEVKVMGGYMTYIQSADGLGPEAADANSVYGQLELRHRLNRWLTYTLTGGRRMHLGLQYGTSLRNLDLTFTRLSLNWNLVRDMRISLPLYFESGEETGATGETFERLGTGLAVSRMVTQKLSAGLGYTFYWKDSDRPTGDYVVNIVSLNFGYNF